MGGLRIVKVGEERIDDLGPLWKSMQAHHREVAREIPGIPLREPEDSWARRRAEYLRWLAQPGAFALIAEIDGTAVGYTLVTIYEPGDDTHVTGERFAEMQSLSVLPEHRGGGIGNRLMEAVYEELRAIAVREMVIGVMAGNEGAARLYERHGFRPWVLKYIGRIPDG